MTRMKTAICIVGVAVGAYGINAGPAEYRFAFTALLTFFGLGLIVRLFDLSASDMLTKDRK